MQIDKRNRSELKTFFVENAIPTESNFADLIDGALNQRDDGIAKPPGDALAIEAAGDATSQKKAIQFYTNFADTDPAWLLSLNPRQNPADAATARPGFSVSDGAGNSRLFIERTTGRIGLGTNTPQVALDVIGGVQANGYRGRYDLVLNDYRTVNPASNVCLQSPGNDRDAWIYRDAADTARNWGIYHRQIDSPVAGLPGNAIGFIGGTSSKLQAYVNLADGSGFFAGGLAIQGMVDVNTSSTVWGGWLEAIRFSRAEHSAITHPGGKLLFGMHSDRNFYFADTDAQRYTMVLSPGNGGMLGIGTNGPPERPFHVRSSIVDWQARFQNDSATANVYLAHGGGFGMHVRTDTAVTTNYLLELYNGTQGGSLVRVATSGDTVIAKSLTVAGAIIPSVGNSAAKGIQFPSNPGGGGGDEAFIRYYPVSGETCKLMIGINNDPEDTIGFLQAGAERMTVGPGWIDVTAEGNPLRFTSVWSGSPDGAGVNNRSEISNDTGSYKTLMLVGNKSSGTRRVSVWDRLEVNGTFWVNGTQRFDLAEVTPARAGDQLEQGDVVVIDRDHGLRVCRSTRPHDTAAYGVVSSYHQAAMVIGGFGGLEEMTQTADKRPIALAGRVKVKVCGESGPIRAGDLLTTSSIPGHAMRCAEPAAHPGAIVGKALEPFAGETGTVTALVTLQ